MVRADRYHIAALIIIRFDIRLDAGPLIKGVPNALHQSFTTREEATRVFAEERAKGNTRIVDPDALPSVPQRSRSASSANPVPNVSSSSRTSFSSDPSTHIRTTNSTTSNLGRRYVSQMPSSMHSSPLDRSPSEPSPETLRRLQAIQAALDEVSNPVGVQVPTTHSQVPRISRSPWGGSVAPSRGLQRAATASPTMFGGWISSEHDTLPGSWMPPRAVVKTPSWLAPYPKAQPSSITDEALSPLSSEDLKLTSFSINNHHCSQSLMEAPKRLTSKQPSLTANWTPKNESSSVDDSTIYLGSPVARRRHVLHDIDPRSPILSESQVPELSFRRYGTVSPRIDIKLKNALIQCSLFRAAFPAWDVPAVALSLSF